MHDLLIVLHAAAGVVCFAAGAAALTVTTTRSWQFAVYAASLAGMVLFMIIVVAVDWPDLDGSARGIYTSLILLGGYMLWRGARARTRLARHDDGWRAKYADDIGFTLISLFDGFVIVSAIDLGAPVWLVIVIAMLGVAGGITAMNQVKRRLAAI